MMSCSRLAIMLTLYELSYKVNYANPVVMRTLDIRDVIYSG